jgi:hypothetical protein
MLLTEGFLGWGFFGIGSTLINAHTLPGQTEGLKVGCGMGGRWDGCMGGRRNGWMSGWVDGWGVRLKPKVL